MKDELNFIYNRRQGEILIEAVEHYIHTLHGLKRNVIRDSEPLSEPLDECPVHTHFMFNAKLTQNIGDLEDILDKLGD